MFQHEGQHGQFSPIRLQNRPATNIFLAHNRILLLEATDMCGRAMFGSEWTGLELLARRHLQTPRGPINIVTPASSIANIVPRTAQNYWIVETTRGVSQYQNYGEAIVAWGNEKEGVQNLYKIEVDARARYAESVRKLRALLVKGDLVSFLFAPKSGQEYLIPTAFWLSQDGEMAFELGDEIGKWNNPNAAAVPIHGQPSFTAHGNVVLDSEQSQVVLTSPSNANIYSGQSTIAAKTKCFNWLVLLMEASQRPNKAKPDFFKDAKSKFPGLSERAFNIAWSEAAEKTGATGWTAAGRKRSIST